MESATESVLKLSCVRTALVARRWYGPAVVVGKEKIMCS